MKICMFSTSQLLNNPTGGEKRFMELYNYLKNNHETVLYSCDEEKDFIEKGIKKYHSLKKTSDRKISLNIIKNNKKDIKKIKEEKYDEVIVFDVATAIVLSIYNIKNICLFFRQDTIGYKRISCQDMGYSKLKTTIVLFILNIFEGICIHKSKKICVQCKYDLEEIKKRHVFLRRTIDKKSFIQINNVNPSWINSQTSAEDNKDKIYDLVFVGNFRDSRKGHDILLRSIKRMTDEGEEIKVAIIGDGKDLEKYKTIYKEYRNISFLGRTSNPIPTIKNSKLMIVPSYADSCPNTVMEALFHGVSVIGAESGGIPEILNNREWLFQLDEQQIINRIKNSLLNLTEIKKEQQKRKEELTFDWGKMVEEKIIK